MSFGLVLASASPRRRELLESAGFSFDVLVSDIDESQRENEPPKDYVARLSREKAQKVITTAAAKLPTSGWVVGADTIVVSKHSISQGSVSQHSVAQDSVSRHDGSERILGKPLTPEEAVATLQALSGRTHQVMTAYSLLFHGEKKNLPESFLKSASFSPALFKPLTRVVRTAVTFRALNASEIEHYVHSGEPMDKAGAYGIQGGAAHFVERISGSYTGVVGLPLGQVVADLERRGVQRKFPLLSRRG